MNDQPVHEFKCPICGSPMIGVHCKLRCDNCGYVEDCSDLFPADRNDETLPASPDEEKNDPADLDADADDSPALVPVYAGDPTLN